MILDVSNVVLNNGVINNNEVMESIYDDIRSRSLESSISDIDSIIVNRLAEIKYLSKGVSLLENSSNSTKVMDNRDEFLKQLKGDSPLVYMIPIGVKVKLVYAEGKLLSTQFIDSNGISYILESCIEEMFESVCEGLYDFDKAEIHAVVTLKMDYIESNRVDIVPDIIEKIERGHLDKLDIFAYSLRIEEENLTQNEQFQYLESIGTFKIVEYWELGDTGNEDINEMLNEISQDIKGIYQSDECEYLSRLMVWCCKGCIYEQRIYDFEVKSFSIDYIQWEYYDGFLPTIYTENPICLQSGEYIEKITLSEPSTIWRYSLTEEGILNFIYSDIIGVVPYINGNIEIDDCINMCIERRKYDT